MKSFAPLLLSCVTLLTPAALRAATPFEGRITATITNDGRTVNIDYAMKPGLLRADIQTGGHQIISITDFAKQETSVLMPQQHLYLVISLQQAIAAAHQATGDDSSFEKTGETKDILGYTCVKCLAKSQDGSVTEIWAVEGLGQFMGLGGGNPLRPSQPKPWEKEMMDRGFFPLLVIGHSPAGGETFRMEATSVEKQTLPDSTFRIPDGYRRFEMPGMMGGLNPFGHR